MMQYFTIHRQWSVILLQTLSTSALLGGIVRIISGIFDINSMFLNTVVFNLLYKFLKLISGVKFSNKILLNSFHFTIAFSTKMLKILQNSVTSDSPKFSVSTGGKYAVFNIFVMLRIGKSMLNHVWTILHDPSHNSLNGFYILLLLRFVALFWLFFVQNYFIINQILIIWIIFIQWS